MKPIYLDANATTPLDPQVFEAMTPYFLDKFGNPSSKTHSYGWDADLAIENARKQIATLINGQPKEIYFTSGATESNNLALLGLAQAFSSEKVHMISTLTEHSSILEPLKHLAQNGVEVTLLKPDSYGRVSPDKIQEALKPHTRLISTIWANNEIGTLNPIQEIGALCETRNILFHVDACQGAAYLPLNVQKDKIHLLSLSSHKMYGPKGAGALFVRHTPQRVHLLPILFGAGHEGGLRPGTPNVPSIVGFGMAAEIAKKEMKATSSYLKEIRDQILLELLELPFVQLNGHPTLRLPNNLNLTFQGIPSSKLIKKLSNLAFSTGSACSTDSPKPSHVLSSIGLNEDQFQSSIRLGLSKFLSQDQVSEVIRSLKKAALQIQEHALY